MGWLRSYRTTFALGAVFVALIVVFALTPDPDLQGVVSVEPTSEPTAGPDECVVCPIDQECDARTGQCRFIDHTPWPCVPSARFDDEAGQCLPEGAPPPPAPEPVVTAEPRTPRQPAFPPGIGGPNRLPRRTSPGR